MEFLFQKGLFYVFKGCVDFINKSTFLQGCCYQANKLRHMILSQAHQDLDDIPQRGGQVTFVADYYPLFHSCIIHHCCYYQLTKTQAKINPWYFAPAAITHSPVLAM